MEDSVASVACAQCGKPVPGAPSVGPAYCCAGCAFMHALAPAETPAVPPATSDRVHSHVETLLHVEGVTCSGCVARVQAALASVPGVHEARLNLATRRATVVGERGVPLETLVEALARAGYRAREARGDAAEARAERRRSLWRMALAGFAMMQIMMFAFPAYIAEEGSLPWDVERLFALASLALTVPVLLVSARPIFAAAWRGLASRSPGMDVPVALGLVVSFVASVHNTFAGGDVYYDSIAMFVFFLLVGRHLENAALARAAQASESLATLLPERAHRITSAGVEEIDSDRLARGDHVAVGVGESAPADLVVLAGVTQVDEALVTGESAPVAKGPGDEVLAGTVNLCAPLEARVERCGADQTLERIRRLVERAAADKPRWTLIADRIARHFALAVIALAALGGLAWLWIDPARAPWIAVATLVVSCPCALALATPAAVTAALNRLARRGVLVTRGAALESLAAVTHVVFDKTGTLTTGRMQLESVETFGCAREDSIAIAAALESALPHPIAHALARESAKSRKATALIAHPGEGVEGSIDGKRHRVGSAAYCAALCGSAPPVAAESTSPIAFLADEERFLAVFRLTDAPRPEAAVVLARLRAAGCEIVMLSGDRAAVVNPVAEALGIRERVAAANPEAKAKFVERLMRTGARVAMVGDGVNDAPVLAGSHVAFALGNGAAAAQSHADFVLVQASLEGIPEALETARRTRTIVKQGLAWAAAYNALTLPLALAGLLTPWLASLGMSLSSLLVVANALRLAPRAPSLSPLASPLPAWTSSIS